MLLRSYVPTSYRAAVDHSKVARTLRAVYEEEVRVAEAEREALTERLLAAEATNGS